MWTYCITTCFLKSNSNINKVEYNWKGEFSRILKFEAIKYQLKTISPLFTKSPNTYIGAVLFYPTYYIN